MNRREFLGASSASLVGSAMTSAPPNAEGNLGLHSTALQSEKPRSSRTSRPNLILFMPDEMRADSLACYGNPVTHTPNFDLVARQGTRFEQAHVQFPVCGASRCSMLTGWPTGVRGHRSLYYFLRPEEPNLFRYLRRAGYDVYWYGKNDALAAQSFYDSATEWNESNVHAVSYASVREQTPGVSSMLLSPLGDRRETGDYLNVKAAIEVLSRRESERPFCIFLPLFHPHPPYTAPADFYNLYLSSTLPKLTSAKLEKKPDFHEGIRQYYRLGDLDDRTFQRIRAVYYGQVSYSDWLLGELLEALEKTGREKDTALFVTSDHGDYAGDYGLVEKWPSGLEDALTRVPLFGRVPGLKAGVVHPHLVELYDIMQTFLDLAGARASHTHFARTLLPQMAGAVGNPDRAAFSEGGYNVYEPQCFEPLGVGAVSSLYEGKIRLQNEHPKTVSRSSMIRTCTHKLIMRPQGQSELYDYGADPREEQNLFGEKGSDSVQYELQGKLLEHYINTTGIAPNDKDPRSSPPFVPTKTDLTTYDWQSQILDR